MRTIFFFTSMLLIPLLAQEGSRLPDAEFLALSKAFDDKIGLELGLMRSSQFATLEKRYLDALKREKAAAQQRGDLVDAKLFDSEIHQIEGFMSRPGSRITAASVDPQPGFAKVRGIYLSEVGKFEAAVYKSLEPIAVSHERLLKELTVKLTRQGKLAEADMVKSEMSKIPVAVCRITDGKYAPLQNAGKAYANREYVWAQIPDALTGLDFNMTAGGVAKACEIDVLRPGTIYIAVLTDQFEQTGKILSAEGFKKTTHEFTHTPRGGGGMMVFSKYVVQGFSLPAVAGNFSGFVVIGNLR